MKKNTLSIIIPCFNEENYIEKIINKIEKNPYKNYEIIAVDDCSTDNTLTILKKLQKKKKIHQLHIHKKNSGKGSAIRTGIHFAKGEFLIIQDADLEYDPNEYSKLLKPILDNEADIVYGSRFSGSDVKRVLYFYHRIGNALLTLTSNIFTNLNLSDMETCYKVFKTSIIQNIKIEEDRFGFEPEITAKISKLNLKIFEVGISYHGRTYAEGKKIGIKDGLRAFYCILKYNIFK